MKYYYIKSKEQAEKLGIYGFTPYRGKEGAWYDENLQRVKLGNRVNISGKTYQLNSNGNTTLISGGNSNDIANSDQRRNQNESFEINDDSTIKNIDNRNWFEKGLGYLNWLSPSSLIGATINEGKDLISGKNEHNFVDDINNGVGITEAIGDEIVGKGNTSPLASIPIDLFIDALTFNSIGAISKLSKLSKLNELTKIKKLGIAKETLSKAGKATQVGMIDGALAALTLETLNGIEKGIDKALGYDTNIVKDFQIAALLLAPKIRTGILKNIKLNSYFSKKFNLKPAELNQLIDIADKDIGFFTEFKLLLPGTIFKKYGRNVSKNSQEIQRAINILTIFRTPKKGTKAYENLEKQKKYLRDQLKIENGKEDEKDFEKIQALSFELKNIENIYTIEAKGKDKILASIKAINNPTISKYIHDYIKTGNLESLNEIIKNRGIYSGHVLRAGYYTDSKLLFGRNYDIEYGEDAAKALEQSINFVTTSGKKLKVGSVYSFGEVVDPKDAENILKPITDLNPKDNYYTTLEDANIIDASRAADILSKESSEYIKNREDLTGKESELPKIIKILQDHFGKFNPEKDKISFRELNEHGQILDVIHAQYQIPIKKGAAIYGRKKPLTSEEFWSTQRTNQKLATNGINFVVFKYNDETYLIPVDDYSNFQRYGQTYVEGLNKEKGGFKKVLSFGLNHYNPERKTFIIGAPIKLTPSTAHEFYKYFKFLGNDTYDKGKIITRTEQTKNLLDKFFNVLPENKNGLVPNKLMELIKRQMNQNLSKTEDSKEIKGMLGDEEIKILGSKYPMTRIILNKDGSYKIKRKSGEECILYYFRNNKNIDIKTFKKRCKDYNITSEKTKIKLLKKLNVSEKKISKYL